MKTISKQKGLLILYTLLSILEILGTLLDNQMLIFATKPLLMPVLLLWFLSLVTLKSRFKNVIAVSIIFGFLGDTFLLFAPQNELFFLLGLGAFLVGQVLYGVGFIQNVKASSETGVFKTRVLAVFVFGAIYIALLTSLWASLGEFLVPVVVYGLAICFMGVTAAFRYNVVVSKSFWLVFAGALTFVASDTVIAVDKFIYLSEMPFANSIIMTTYCLAQYLIVKGAVVYLKN